MLLHEKNGLEDARAIADFLSESKVQILELSGEIEDESVAVIAQALKNSHLVELRFVDSGMGESGALALAKAVKDLSLTVSLEGHTNIGTNVAHAIENAMMGISNGRFLFY